MLNIVTITVAVSNTATEEADCGCLRMCTKGNWASSHSIRFA